MRCSMIRSWLKGIQHYKSGPCCRSVPGFNSAKEIRSTRMIHSMTQANSFDNTNERSEMMALWPGLVVNLTKSGLHSNVPEATEWMAKVLNYNVPGGKLHRALSIIYSYRMLAHPEQLTDENLKLVRVLAWCHEMNQAVLQVQDDLMDRSKTRRGQICWYLCNNIGVSSVNDSLILEHAAYLLLKIYFNKHKCYLNLFETFTENTLHVALGQALDIKASNHENESNMNLFTTDRWNRTTTHRGSYYSYAMPVKLAMYLADITDPEVYRQTEPILLELGDLYTAQNDYFDCYGDPNVTGHIGNDIEGGKCSWVIVTALQHATPAQKKILQECYGHENPDKVARVKQVYNELDLPTIYANYEEEAYNSIKAHVEKMTCNFPKELFDVLLAMTYRRTA